MTETKTDEQMLKPRQLGKSEKLNYEINKIISEKDAEIERLVLAKEETRLSRVRYKNLAHERLETITDLESKLKIAVEALEEFKKFGTRHDTTPTGQMMSCGCFNSFKGDHWQSYIKSQDSSVKERAKDALAKIKE